MTDNVVKFRPKQDYSAEDELRLAIKAACYAFVGRVSLAQVIGVMHIALDEMLEEQE